MNIYKIALILLLGSGTVALEAQSTAPSTGASTSSAVASVGVPTVVGRSPNERVWATLSSVTNRAGNVITVTNSTFTEVGANLCVQDTNGNWVDSDSTLSIVADGAASGNSPLSVHFSGDANAEGGAVRLRAPDGKVFISRVYGISYYDAASGSNVLIAPLQSCQGQLVGTNRVLFANAFVGLKADIWYTFTIKSFDQDVVLHESPPSPAIYGLSPQSSRLQIWTEWLNPPEPRHIPAEDDGITHDAYLDFGNLIMGPGAALFTQGQGDPTPVRSGAIYKHWQNINGQDWLIEEIPYQAVADVLQALPLHASAVLPGSGMYKSIAASQPLRSKAGVIAKGLGQTDPDGRRSAPSLPPGEGFRVSQRSPLRDNEPSLILDYSVVSSVTNFTFKADTTYYVSTNVTLSGTNTTFEGCTVIKYATNTTLTVDSPITWAASAYHPVTLTAKTDNTVGGSVASGNPSTNYYANTALFYNAGMAGTNLVINHLRVLNAATAICISSNANHVLSDVQLVRCGNGIAATNTSFSLWNALMYNVMTNFTGNSSTGDVEQITVDTANWLNNSQTLNLTNCLLVAVTNLGTITGSNSIYSASSGSGVFQTVGGGSHYLPATSSYVNAGTTNINPTLAAALTNLTVFAPVLLTNNFTTNTTLSPQVLRNAGVPSSGFSYDPLDYTWTNRTINSGVTLTLTNGVAVGVMGVSGITVNGTLISQGTPLLLNQLGPAGISQELSGTNLVTLLAQGSGTWTSMFLRFNDLPILGGSSSSTYGSYLTIEDGTYPGPATFWDCQLTGGSMTVILLEGFGAYPTLNLYNNLLYRTSFSFQANNLNSFLLNCANNLFSGGSFSLWFSITNSNSAPYWLICNNLFDNCSMSESGNDLSGGTVWPTHVNNDHNAYISSSSLLDSGGGDIHPGIADFQAGALGNYYYPTTGTNLESLIHTGDRLASVAGQIMYPTCGGLYHYTVTTNNVVEGTNTVSIGFHYIAVDTNGIPLDSNGNGIPDYLEDANGDGIYGAGDLGNWLAYIADTNNWIGLTIYTPMQ